MEAPLRISLLVEEATLLFKGVCDCVTTAWIIVNAWILAEKSVVLACLEDLPVNMS